MALTADQLIQEIETMTVLELANLVKALEERFGVSAAVAAAKLRAASMGWTRPESMEGTSSASSLGSRPRRPEL